jgi:hypothetical protein
VNWHDKASFRASIAPRLRERAARWPRDLVDAAVVEIDERYARRAPDAHANILAAVEQFAGELEVRTTKHRPQ